MYFLAEINEREKLAKKLKRWHRITTVLDMGLITTTIITGGITIAAIPSGIGLPVGINISTTSLLLPLATAVTRKKIGIFNTKQKKHNDIKMLSKSKYDSISRVISQALQDVNISQNRVS